MNDDLKFDYPIVEAIRAGKKIEAIKLLRESRGIGLKDAKELVDQYYKINDIQPPAGSGGISGNTLLFLVFIAGACYLLYSAFA